MSVSFFISVKAITNYLLIMISQFSSFLHMFYLFGNPLKPSIGELGILVVFSIVGWLLSTKHPYFQSLKWKLGLFLSVYIGITAYYTWLLTSSAVKAVVPYIQEKVLLLETQDVWHSILVGNPDNLTTFIVFIPSIVVLMLQLWIFGQYSMYSEDVKEAFRDFEFSSWRFQSFILKGKEEKWPDIVLGRDSKTKELIIQPGRDRTLNNSIIGGIGTGKTAAIVSPILNQDLHWMAKYINAFKNIFKREDFHTEDVKGTYMNGISVIEPSNDLCQKIFKLVKAHKIPEECVFYIDPTNPDTPSINPMQGPVDQVAEAFAMVMEGLAEAGESNFFFQQSERNHLKHYIYLLKLHDEKKEVTFDMLLDMYNNPTLVRKMHEQLKERIPKDIDSIQDRDERNHWLIVKQIDEWFDMNLLPLTNRDGSPQIITQGKYRGEPAYYDAKEQYVQGLRNILNDIGANKLVRRVLFGKSDFNFDRHLEYGGVLLVNTAKGELAGLSNVLGKLVLLSLQNAVFRRKPNVSSFHHILVDEFPDYVYRPFKEFPAQSRKYKVIITIVAQTIAQLADKYGNTYMETLLGTTRHKMVYGDVPDFDSQMFSRLFGEKTRFEETTNEQTVSPLQESPMTRAGVSYQKVKEPILSPSDIMYQDAFQCAVKLVEHNRPRPVRQIDANFVPKEEFDQAVVEVEEEAARIWMEERKRFLSNNSTLLETFEVEEETDHEAEKINEEKEHLSLEPHVEQPVSTNYISDTNLRDVEEEPNTQSEATNVPTEVVEVSTQQGKTNQETSSKEVELSKEERIAEEKIIDETEALNDIFGNESSERDVSMLGQEQEALLDEIEKALEEDESTKEPDKKGAKNENPLESIADVY